MSSPFITPGTPPIQPTQPSTEAPKMGPESSEQKQFGLPKGKEGPEVIEQMKQSPMDAAKDKPASVRWTNDQMVEQLEATKLKFAESKTKLNGPEGLNLTKDHESALSKLSGLMDKDLRSIAQRTQGAYEPPAKKGSVVEHLANWLDQAQGAMDHALTFKPAVGADGNINPADFLKLQFSVQRASQRAEVFSSVISSSVSGIKTLMSTQLG